MPPYTNLLDRSYGEVVKNSDDDDEWYKKTDCWKNRKTESDKDEGKTETEPKVEKKDVTEYSKESDDEMEYAHREGVAKYGSS
jgi:hypothetical protein